MIKYNIPSFFPLVVVMLATAIGCGSQTLAVTSEARTIKVAEFAGSTFVTAEEAELVAEVFALNDELQFDQALEILNPILEEDPDNIVALILRARTYSNAGEGELALADAEVGLAIEPDNPNLLAAQGGALFVLEDNEAALIALNRALEIAPSYHVALNNRGIVYYSQGLYEKAIADYTAALEANPDDANIYLLNRGTAHYELGNSPSKAIADYTDAIETRPNDVSAYFNRGNVYMGIEDYNAAVEDYTIAIEINPDDEPNFYYNRGVAYSQLGETELAQQDWAIYTEMTGNPAP